MATEWLNIKKEKEGVVNPISLLRAIHKKFDHFSVLEQNDSVEYLRCIILSLAEQEKFNFIQHLFQGQLESHMKCLKCNKVIP